MAGVDGRSVKRLRLAAGPADFRPVDSAPVAEAEVQGLRGLRQISTRGMNLPDHDRVANMQSDQGPDRIAVARSPGQPEGDVVLLGEMVAEIVRPVVEVVDDQVQAAIAIEVGG